MNAWIKRKAGPDEVVKVVPDGTAPVVTYNLHLAYQPGYLGRILFDANGYWIYDGDELSIAEQEQLARFIQHNAGLLVNS